MSNLSTPPHPLVRRPLRPACFAALLAVSLAVAPALAQTRGVVDNITKAPGLADQYSDFNTHLIQIQTVKSIPFFNKTPTQRMQAVRGYYSSVRQGNVRSAGSSVRSDFTNGALVKDVGIAAMTQVLTQVSQGKSMDQAVSGTFKYMTSPEYLIGNLMGGTVGAALATMIPVPVVGGFLGQLIAQVPTMTGAMLGSNVGSKVVHGVRHGNLDLGEVFRSIDWLALGFQSVGATAGMMLGASLPVPFLGQLIGGVLGGQVGQKAAVWVKKKAGWGEQAHDYIDIPDFDPNTAGWGLPPVPAWATGSGAGAQPAPVAGGISPSFAPAAPTSDPAALQARMLQALSNYQAAEKAGDRAAAAQRLVEYDQARQALNAVRAAR